jgi:hypothetical protein
MQHLSLACLPLNNYSLVTSFVRLLSLVITFLSNLYAITIITEGTILKQRQDNQYSNTQYNAYHAESDIVLFLRECSYTDSQCTDNSYAECHCAK